MASPALSLASSAPDGRCGYRGVPKTDQGVIQNRQRDRASRHIQRRHIWSNKRSRNRCATPLELAPRRIVHQVELHCGRGAEAVDEEQGVFAAEIAEVVCDRFADFRSDAVGALELVAAAARFAV